MLKFQHLGLTTPNLKNIKPMRAPPAPAITVLAQTIDISAPAPGVVIVPRDPPLNAKNPVMRIIPPIPIS